MGRSGRRLEVILGGGRSGKCRNGINRREPYMKHALLLVAVVAALAVSGPAYSQYMYLDTNNDGICDPTDVLTPASTSVDVWLDTDSNADGSPAACNSGSENLTINSYEFFLRATGALTYGTWTDNMAFATSFGDFAAGTDAYSGRGSGTILAPGLYKLGTMTISGVGSATSLAIVAASSVNNQGFTSFGTECAGNDFDNTYKLASDWNDVCGSAITVPVTQTTWGAIKNIYR
jgi:hypothetical protein